MLAKLNAPFPVPKSWRESIVTFAAVACFITLFLWLFKPFGLHAVDGSIIIISVCFGAITFSCGIAYRLASQLLLGDRMHSSAWTLWKWIVYVLGLVGIISFGNFLYLKFLFPETFRTLADLLWMLVNTLLLGSIPVAFIGLLIQFKAQQHFLMQAQQLSIQPSKGSQGSAQRADSVFLEVPLNKFENKRIASEDILYVEALQNYIVVYWLVDDKVGKDIIRKTLSQISKELQTTSTIRCHRSFLLNTAKVAGVEGNAQGFKVRIIGLPEIEIPVSRTYIKPFQRALSQQNDPE